MERTLGQEHPDALPSKNDLAIVLRGLGDYAAARELDAQLLGARERTLEPDHPLASLTKNNLADCLD
ncbi:MAG: tetratricopeptide repeat protein [Deltaproteobacteria bacterium]|nr:tetratricopeptide repeat protein [Deltaproteobacteria bacterium]